MRLFSPGSWPPFGLILLVFVVCATLQTLQAQPDRIDPRHPSAGPLPESGRMVGSITTVAVKGTGENFGRRIEAVGDVNNDTLADWIVEHLRCDTLITTWAGGQYYAEEVVLYHGVRAGLPSVDSGQRIGPTDISSKTTFLAAGDWDNDAHQDIAVRMELYDDTASGNIEGYSTAWLVVFWGNAEGRFTLSDTSHLNSVGALWLGINSGFSSDLDGDGIADLGVLPSAAFSNGAPIQQPRVTVFKGQSNGRWGRNGISNAAAWGMWGPPIATVRLTCVDQDCDGHPDIVFHKDDESLQTGYLSVLYGRANAFPDTTEYESIGLDSANGHYTLFSDVTGDGTLDLLVTCGLEEVVRIYAGRPGQRLHDMYGTGKQGPVSGHGWWRRPWAEIPLPRSMNDGWAYSQEKLYDLGDGNGDGIPEVWCMVQPFLVGYSGGYYLDSLIDALHRMPYGLVTGAARLGDIDGSGVATIAIGYDQIPHDPREGFPGGIIFAKPSREIPFNGMERPLPHLPGESCGGTAAVQTGVAVIRSMNLR